MTCPDAGLLAANADGETTANEAAAIDRHLAGCPSCRRADRQLRRVARALAPALARAPDPAFAARTMARTRPRATRRRSLLAASFALAAAGVTLVVFHPSRGRSPFAARGGASLPAELVGFTAYVHAPGEARAKAVLTDGVALRPSEGLSISVRNGAGRPMFAAVFVVDAKGEVTWLAPEWTDGATNPPTTRLEAGARSRSSTAVSLAGSPPGPLRVVGLFSPAALRVGDVEAAVARHGVAALARTFSGAATEVVDARLVPEP